MSFVKDINEVFAKVVNNKGVVIIQGDRGVGKTRMCEQLIKHTVKFGIKTAYIDAEVGQGIIAAPGTITMSVIDTEFTSIRHLKRRDWYFLGALSPVGHGINVIYGMSKMVKRARELDCEVIVIDSCGYIDYKDVVIYKQNEIEIIAPDFIIAIQKSHEIEFAICPFIRRNNVICTLFPCEEKHSYSSDIMLANLRADFSNGLQNLKSHVLPIGQVSFTNTWLYNGREIKWHYKLALEKILKSEVLHGELACKTLFVFARGTYGEKEYLEIKELFGVADIVIQSPDIFNGLYVGLEDENTDLLGLGIIENIAFNKRQIMLKSTAATMTPIKNVKFGFFSLNPYIAVQTF